MNQVNGLISVVIPAYNAANFIGETINSILSQTYSLWEIIVVNDGSPDNTEEIVRSFPDSRITVVSQTNAGVSAARNKGIKHIKGEFVCFFDADDLMTPEFLEVRINILSRRSDIGFVGGLVETFPESKPVRRAVAENPEQEIHFFDATVATIPSNYLFRTSVIKENNILFNTALNSSADRFFLLQVTKYTKGKALTDKEGSLRYRISEMSMSHHVTPRLVLDYYRFYQELNSKKLLPIKKKREIQCRYLFSLASSFSLVGYWGSVFRLLFRSFYTHPVVFLKLSTQKIFGRYNKNPKENNGSAH
jgi:teichuronic acid biosynthesis glycosyltransferase TuaG